MFIFFHSVPSANDAAVNGVPWFDRLECFSGRLDRFGKSSIDSIDSFMRLTQAWQSKTKQLGNCDIATRFYFSFCFIFPLYLCFCACAGLNWLYSLWSHTHEFIVVFWHPETRGWIKINAILNNRLKLWYNVKEYRTYSLEISSWTWKYI